MIGLSACPQKTVVWISHPSLARTPEFVVSQRRDREIPVRFYDLLVLDCSSLNQIPPAERVWHIAEDLANTPHPYPTRVLYGQVPVGFQELTPAKPLTEGCYVAETLGTGRVRFQIDHDGKVIEEPE